MRGLTAIVILVPDHACQGSAVLRINEQREGHAGVIPEVHLATDGSDGVVVSLSSRDWEHVVGWFIIFVDDRIPLDGVLAGSRLRDLDPPAACVGAGDKRGGRKNSGELHDVSKR